MLTSSFRRGGAQVSEERFDRIELRLDRLEHGQEELRTDVTGLRTDVNCLRGDVDGLRAGVDDLRVGQEALRTEVGELRAGQQELRHHMGVLHEEVLDRIQALVFDPEPLRREFKAADDALREEIGRRLDPVEAALRLKRRR